VGPFRSQIHCDKRFSLAQTFHPECKVRGFDFPRFPPEITITTPQKNDSGAHPNSVYKGAYRNPNKEFSSQAKEPTMRTRPSHFASAVIAILAIVSISPLAHAQKEFPPPQGKGRVVVISSGASGMDHYETVAKAIAALGYDVVLYDGNSMEGTKGAALKEAIPQALQMPHALPGKVALVGFSLGGGMSLAYGTNWPDQVAVVIVWYPLTSVFKDIPAFAARMKVPVLMFAGENDKYKDCCLIGTAHAIADAAKTDNQPFDLFTYPKTEHDFVKGGDHYNANSYNDALDKTAAKLKEFLGN
jgi:dienelactone hydrolase